ncbi:MAG: hypothetical protein RL142_891 [Actinomycetota bacterium]|jgi:hypothetical protein
MLIFAQASAIGFYLVCLFQLALLLGAPLGEYTQGGGTKGKLGRAGRIGAAVSIVILLVMSQAILATQNVGLFVGLPAWLLETLKWLTFAYSVLGVLMNWASRSKKERMIWGPFASVMAVFVSLAIFG